MQEYRNLQKEMLQLKSDLQSVKVPVPNEGLDINSMEDVSRDIDFYSVSHVSAFYLFVTNFNYLLFISVNILHVLVNLLDSHVFINSDVTYGTSGIVRS